VQILTIRELLEEHRKPDLPLLELPAFHQAEKVELVSAGRKSCSAGAT
jgi:hypothetical protein